MRIQYYLSAFLVLASAGPVFCARDTKLPPDPYTQTMWDRIMIQQSYRNMQKGMVYMQNGDYQKAAREFGRAAVENKDDAWPHILLGSSLYWLGDVEQAMTEYETALEIDPKNAQAHQLMGIAHAWKGDAPSALKSFLAAEKYEPSRSDVQMDIGSIYESLGQHGTALDYFRRAVKLEPRHPLYRYQLGLLQTRLGMDEDAISSFQQALSLYPDYEDAMLELGALHEKNGKTEDALSLFKRAVRVKPQDSVARFRYARLLAETGRGKDAGEVLKYAFSLTPNQKGDGISLSLAYSGNKADSGLDRQSSGGSGNGGGSEGAKQNTPEQNKPDEKKTNPVDSLRRNLERVPLDQEITVQAEIVYLPQPKTELKVVKPSDKETKSKLASALKKNLKEAPEAMSLKRQYSIPASDAAKRREMIKSLADDLGTTISQIPADSNMRMALNIDTKKPSSDGGGSDGQNGAGAASAGPGRSQNKNARVTYNPRQVGNDMGLWVMGSSWLDLVNEALPEVNERLEKSSSPQLWLTAGLGHVIMGEANAALEKFERALELGAGAGAHLGRATAYIEMGDEASAIAACRAALKLDPGNKIAEQNLKWLETPSTVD